MLLLLASVLVAASSAASVVDDAEIIRRRAEIPGWSPGHLPWSAPVADSYASPSEYQPRPFPSILGEDGPRKGVLYRRLSRAVPALARATGLDRNLFEKLQAFQRSRGGPDTVRIVALRVDFLKDSAGSGTTTPDGRFDLRCPDSARVAVDPPPHNRAYFEAHLEALRRYYWRQSRGQVYLTFDVYPVEPDSAYHLEDTAKYGPWDIHDMEKVVEMAERFVRDSFAAAESSGAAPNFGLYDSFIIFHAGADFQGDIDRDSPYDIPSFNISLAEPVAVCDSTVFLDYIMVVPETVSQDRFLAALNGVLAHEYGHQLGFFDLYDTFTFFPAVGMFSLMDSGESLYGRLWDPYQQKEVFVRGLIPASVDPWHKMLYFAGGLDVTWAEDGSDTLDLTLEPVQTTGQLVVIPLGGRLQYDAEGSEVPDFPEYFVLESRPFDLNGDEAVYLQADSATGVVLGPRNAPDSLSAGSDSLGAFEQDYLLPGSGVLIWHIDNIAASDAFSLSGYVSPNISPQRRGVDVEEADGIEDLGDIYSSEWTGGRFDYWCRDGYWLFGPQTHPSTASSGGGRTGISVTVLDSAGPCMRVRIVTANFPKGWPTYVGTPEDDAGLLIWDLDGNGSEELLTASGPYVAVTSGDGRAGLLLSSEEGFLPALAAGGRNRVLAAAERRRAWFVFGGGGAPLEAFAYPSPTLEVVGYEFSAGPMLLDSVVVFGCSDGRLRAFDPVDPLSLGWKSQAFGARVTALAAGDVLEGCDEEVAWGTTSGEVFLARCKESGEVGVADGWPAVVESAPIVWCCLVEGQEPLVLAASADGLIVAWAPDGRPADGFPTPVSGHLAGFPAVGDPDGDGELEIAATTEQGEVHLVDLRGRRQRGWPRSVWHPDAPARKPVLSGPLLVDVDGDSHAEVLQSRGDGSMVAFDGMGNVLDSWARAAGFRVAAGPVVGNLGEGAGVRVLWIDEGGYAGSFALAHGGSAPKPGEAWAPWGGPERQWRFVASSGISPGVGGDLLPEGAVFFAPNPVVGASGNLWITLARSASVRLEFFDTSARRVCEMGPLLPHSGPGGDVLELDLQDLSPGLYVVKVTAQATESGEEVTRWLKLGLVR